ncbi:MAG: hypothetical protein ACFFCQ_09325 [Promethearchaeota archaeon]
MRESNVNAKCEEKPPISSMIKEGTLIALGLIAFLLIAGFITVLFAWLMTYGIFQL